MTTNYMYNESENETWQQTGQITDSKQMLIINWQKDLDLKERTGLFLLRPGRWGVGGDS